MRRTRSLLLAARTLLVALAAALALAALLTARRNDAVADRFYTCPMHAEISAAAPGACPICGMALVRRSPGTSSSTLLEQDAGATAVARRRVFSQPVRAPAWVEDGVVEAILYDDDLASMGADESARFRSGDGISLVRRTPRGPVRWDEATARVAFAAAPGGSALAPGATGWLELEERPRSRLVVPITAVIQSEKGPQVLAVARGGRFSPRAVRLGHVGSGLASVVSGLDEGEEVVVRGAWFLEADRRLAPAAEAR